MFVSSVANGLLGYGLVSGGLVPQVTQIFEQALVAKLQAIPELMAIVGNGGGAGLFKTSVQQNWDYGANGPAITYQIIGKPRGHVLTGSDGTAGARVQFDVWSHSALATKRAIEALWNGIDGVPGVWGNGTCVIMAVAQQDETDLDEPPRAASDQWMYHTTTDYWIQYRVALPTLS